MKIKKLKFKNVYGISEVEYEPGNITLISGHNEAGKSSIIDALKTAFSNKSMRTKLIKNGEEEAELFIETDTGLMIDRKKRDEKSDYAKVTLSNRVINSPEGYLKDLFNPEQFNPVKDFIEKTPREQSKILLSLCEISWSDQDWIENFGEIPNDVNPNSHLLENLYKIQAKNGTYWNEREEIGRQKRHKEAVVSDIYKELPDDYNPDEWRNIVLSEKYDYVSNQETVNNKIDSCNEYIKSADDKKETAKLHVNEEYLKSTQKIDMSISKKNEMIRKLQSEIDILESEKKGQKDKADEVLKIKYAEIDEGVEKCKKYLANNEYVDVEPLRVEAREIEKMKEFIKEADRIPVINLEIENLQAKYSEYTTLIDTARELPRKLLKTAKMPIDGVTIGEDGNVYIDDLPLDNLSESRRFSVAIDIAKERAGELKIALVDGFEKFDTKHKEMFIEKAKQSGLQFFIAEVTDSELTVMSL